MGMALSNPTDRHFWSNRIFGNRKKTDEFQAKESEEAHLASG
jgi:hypothetical protein